MDRRGFLKAGVASGTAQYLLSEQIVLAAGSQENKGTLRDTRPAPTPPRWAPITSQAGDDLLRQHAIRILRKTNAKYDGLEDAALKVWLDAVIGASAQKRFDLFGLFKDATIDKDHLMVLMGIRWGGLNSGGNRKDPLLKMVALDERHIPAKNSMNARYRRYLSYVSRQIYEKLHEQAPDTVVDLVIQPDLASQHIRLLTDHARLPGKEGLGTTPKRPKLRETIAIDGTRFWQIDLPAR